jgi:PAS domain S-box-containing protein
MSDPENIDNKNSNLPIEIPGNLFHQTLLIKKTIENLTPSGIAIMDDTGKQVYVNQTFCNLVGWAKEELLGKYPPYVYWSSEDIENIEMAFKDSVDNRVPEQAFELKFRHRNGELINVTVFVSTFFQKDNHKLFLADVTNLTKRKKSEGELTESLHMLSASIDSLKDTIIFSTDTQYRYLYFNKVHWDTMKHAYNAEIKIGSSILDYITSDDDRKLIKETLELALSGKSTSFIQTFGDVNRDYYECYFNPVFNGEKEILGCSVLAKNINERVQANFLLRDSETKFKDIIDQINDIIVVFDSRGRIIVWNKGAENICGLKAKDVLNKDIVDIEVQLLAPPLNDRSRIEKVINGILTQGTPDVFNRITESEIVPINSGKVRNIQSMVFPIKLNTEQLFCTVIRDTTELKRYEKEILRVSAEKDKFYSVIAQYLYTPFNVFNNFTKLMAEELDNLPVKEIQRMVTMMSKSATNVYNLLDNLLQWTKIHQGKTPFEPQVLNLKQVCIEGTTVLKQDSDLKKITIKHNTSDEIHVVADLFMLKTIFRNLVYYVIKFCDPNGQIDINAHNTASNVTVSITGKGFGVNADYLKKLFNTEQIHSVFGQTEDQGTILGLLLCKEFIERHGGEIWAKSNDDKGDGINFTLPAA